MIITPQTAAFFYGLEYNSDAPKFRQDLLRSDKVIFKQNV